jgi:succinoglycan biosynthesis transport protein ExoP
MNTVEQSKVIAVSEKIFRHLLVAYPAAHREEFGEPMTQLFRDQCRDAWNLSRGWGLAWLWLRVLPDVVGTSFMEHLDTIKRRKFMFNRIGNAFGAARFLTVFAFVFLLVVIAATVVTFMLPESFVGTARVNVQRDGAEAKAPAGPIQTWGVDPYLIQSEFEIVQSAAVLDRVVDKMHLADLWGKKFGSGQPLKLTEARALLKQTLDIQPVRNTSLIEIRAYSDKPEEAAELANAVADAYQSYHLEWRQGARDQRINELAMRRDDLRQRTIQLTDELDTLRTNLKVFDPDPQSTGPSSTLSLAAVQQLQTDAARAEAEKAKLDAQLSVLRPLSHEDLRTRIGSVLDPNPRLNNLVGDLAAAQQNLLKLQKTLSNEHPDYIVAKQQIALLDQEINDQVDAIMLGWETRLQSIDRWRAGLAGKIEAANQADAEYVKRTRPYWEAKQKLATLAQIRNDFELKFTFENLNLQSPKEMQVEIIDRATPNLSPVRPNKPMNIAIGIIAGIVLGLIVAAGVSGISFLSRRTTPPKIA